MDRLKSFDVQVLLIDAPVCQRIIIQVVQFIWNGFVVWDWIWGSKGSKFTPGSTLTRSFLLKLTENLLDVNFGAPLAPYQRAVISDMISVTVNSHNFLRVLLVVVLQIVIRFLTQRPSNIDLRQSPNMLTLPLHVHVRRLVSINWQPLTIRLIQIILVALVIIIFIIWTLLVLSRLFVVGCNLNDNIIALWEKCRVLMPQLTVIWIWSWIHAIDHHFFVVCLLISLEKKFIGNIIHVELLLILLTMIVSLVHHTTWLCLQISLFTVVSSSILIF